jgi:hypothetical protein
MLVGFLSALVLPFTLIAWAIVVDNSLSGWKFVAFHGAGAVLFFLGIGLGKAKE